MSLTRNKNARIVAIAAFVMMGCVAAFAQQRTRPRGRIIRISNSSGTETSLIPTVIRARGDHSAENVGPQADAFSLVGTMSYAKGTFAFFDGTSSEYRKALQLDDAIAGYKVTEITPNAVKLQAADKRVEMKVGTQMRKETEGGWQLVGQAELPANSAQDSAGSEKSSDSAGSSSGGEVNDVLKKLMQQREQELK